MKKCTMLVASLILSGCAIGSFPKFPEMVKNQYTLDIVDQPQPDFLVAAVVNLSEIPAFQRGEVVRCLEFEIVSQAPYQIKYLQQVELKVCNGVTGFKPKDAVSIYNWMDDVYRWAQDRKKCFK
jgi:hypothetical protein